MLEVNLSSFFGSSRKGLIKSVKVLEKLQNNFWKVQTPAGVISVFSDEKLEVGKTVNAFIRNERNLLRLVIKNQENINTSPDFFYPNSANLSDLVMKTASRLNIKISERDLYVLKKILEKKKSGKFITPFLLDAIDKGFKSDIQLSALSGSFDRDKGGNRKNSKDQLKKYIKEKVLKAEKTGNSLFLYNHIKNRKDHWIYIPFNIAGDDEIDGVVKICIIGDKIGNICINAIKGDSDEWGFFLSPVKSDYILKVYSRYPEKLKESESFNEFRKKLQNLRVKIDDNVKDIAFFNGYDDNTTDLDVIV